MYECRAKAGHTLCMYMMIWMCEFCTCSKFGFHLTAHVRHSFVVSVPLLDMGYWKRLEVWTKYELEEVRSMNKWMFFVVLPNQDTQDNVFNESLYLLWKLFSCKRKKKMVPYLTVSDFFFCVEILRPSQPNGVMSNAVSLPNHTFTGEA